MTDIDSTSIRKYSHRNSEEGNTHRDSTNSEETITNTLLINPIVDIERQPKRKEILDKVHRRKGLARFLAMAVNNVRDNTRSTQLDAEIDQAQANNHGNGPRVLRVRRLAPSKEAGGSEQKISNHDWKTELGLW